MIDILLLYTVFANVAMAIFFVKHSSFFFMPALASLNWISTFDAWAGFLFLSPLLFLLLMRLFVDRTYCVSLLTDFWACGVRVYHGLENATAVAC